MDALIQALASIDPKVGERTVAPNPNSCQVCNNCEGWENESVTPKSRTLKVDKWPKPGFELKTDARTLIDAANDDCPTCGIFLCTLRTFLLTIEDDLEITGWLPMPRDSLPILSVKATGEVDDKSGLKFELFTAPGNPDPSSPISDLSKISFAIYALRIRV
jgi:hypothetical protein